MCDDEFGREEGSVVCRMLGLPGGVKIHNQAAFGEGEVRLDISMSVYIYTMLLQATIVSNYFVKTQTYVASFSPPDLSIIFWSGMYLEVSPL